MSHRPAAPGSLVLYAGTSPLGLDRTTSRRVREAVRRFHSVSESAPATLERQTVHEAAVGGARNTGPGRMLVRLIRAGVSLNGNAYPAQVLREAATSRAWAKGTKAYINHASPEEEAAHPTGSIHNLAAVLTEDARWDETTQSLVAEVRLFEPWRGRLSEMAEANAIGMSIRAWVSGQRGEYEGRECFIVNKIEGGRSVDFVTEPAAGGGIISVLEAVGTTPVVEAANLGAWLESRLHLALTQYADDMYGDGRLTRTERIALSAAIGDGLQAWAARVEQEAPQLFQRSRWDDPEPETPEPAVADATETSPAADVQPTPEPASENVTDGAPPPSPETTPEEEPMSGSQTGAPPEQAGTVTVPDTGQTAPEAGPQITAESIAQIVAAAVGEATRPLQARLEEFASRDQAREAADRDARNRQAATEAVTVALAATEHADVAGSITSRVVARVTGAVPTTAEGAVDTARLGDLITTVIADESAYVRRERAAALAEAGVGLVYGAGSATTQESADDGLDAVLESFFSSSLGLGTEAAKIAAKGR